MWASLGIWENVFWRDFGKQLATIEGLKRRGEGERFTFIFSHFPGRQSQTSVNFIPFFYPSSQTSSLSLSSLHSFVRPKAKLVSELPTWLYCSTAKYPLKPQHHAKLCGTARVSFVAVLNLSIHPVVQLVSLYFYLHHSLALSLWGVPQQSRDGIPPDRICPKPAIVLPALKHKTNQSHSNKATSFSASHLTYFTLFIPVAANTCTFLHPICFVVVSRIRSFRQNKISREQNEWSKISRESSEQKRNKSFFQTVSGAFDENN